MFSRLFTEDGINIDSGERIYMYIWCLIPHFSTVTLPLLPNILALLFVKCIKVALTCMAKLRDERFVCPGGLNTDTVTCLDIITMKKLSNGACHSILFKLITAILRHESSEALRRR